MAGKYTVELLGALHVTRDGRPRPLTAAASRLVAAVAVRRRISRLELAELLWPETSSTRSASNLRTALSRLRNAEPGLVVIAGETASLSVTTTDLELLSEWISRALGGAEPLPPPVGAHLTLLPGWTDPWIVEAREQLDLLRLHALEVTAMGFLSAGRTGPAAHAAILALALDPLRESAARILIEVHLRGGNAADALRAYRRFAEILAGELGTVPSPSLTAMLAGYLEERHHGPSTVETLLPRARYGGA